MFRMMPLLLSLLMLLAAPRLATAQQATTTPSLDVPQLFAGTCGWCHSDGGRAPGKGPQLMNTVRTDEFIRFRIQHGKEGAMPAFGASFTDADLDAIIRYIRSLKPEQG
jgi:mono/diheme cytochrome c family protein